MASETYEYLKELSKGKEINRWSTPDNLIYDVFRRGGSNIIKVIITFDKDDDFLEVLGVDDDQDKYAWGYFTGNGYYDRDRYQYDQDWEEGYLIRNFNEENKDLVNEILRFSNPTLKYNDDNDDWDNNIKVSRFLSNRFESGINDLIYDYYDEQTDCIFRGGKAIIVKETDKPFNKFGVIQKVHGYKFETSVNVLLTLYRMLKVEDEDIKGLLTKLHEQHPSNKDIGGWENYEYEAFCDDYDSDLEQENFKKHLEKILEEVKEEHLESDYDEYIKLYDKVTELGGFNKWIKISDKNMSVIFKSLDTKTNKLAVEIHKPYKPVERRIVNSLEDLNLTLYHPELFESVRNILKKLL